MRIAVAGFQHETNTFAPVKADYDAFVVERAFRLYAAGPTWTARARQEAPVAGAIATLEASGAEVVPLLWCMATPSAHVTEDAYERIASELLQMIAAAGPLDGICLELHGAMVAEHIDDGEGELLRRIRGLVGKDLPVSVALDLHANVTPTMIEHADYIDMYRYYPHTDMVEAGARAAAGLLRIIKSGRRPAKAFRQIDFLIPINGGCTDFGPARDIYLSLMPEMDRTTPGLLGLSFASAFRMPISPIAVRASSPTRRARPRRCGSRRSRRKYPRAGGRLSCPSSIPLQKPSPARSIRRAAPRNQS